MSHLLLSLISCPNLQADLNEVAATKNEPNEPLPFLQFLTAPFNTNRVLETSVSPGEGKYRNVTLTYIPRVGEGEVATTLTTDCTTTEDAGMDSTTYQIDPTAGVEWKEKIVFADIAAVCKNNQQYIAQRVQAGLSGLRRKMETQLTSQIALLYGMFNATGEESSLLSSNNTLKTIRTVKSGSTDFTEDALQEIVYSAMNSGFSGTPFIFGYNKIYKYMQKAKAVCCANTGIDLMEFMAQNQAMFMASNRIETALGSDKFLVVDPGSLFLLQFNKFEQNSGLQVNDGWLQQGIIVDPVSGIPFNYKSYLDPCGEALNLHISTAFKAVGLPDDMYTGGDKFLGTNGVLRFAVSNS